METLWWLGALPLAVGLWVQAQMSLGRRDRAGARLEEVGVTAIARARPGERVKIVGTLRLAGEPLTAPLSGRACAGYEVIIADDHRHSQPAIAVETRLSDFIVEDDSGRVQIPVAGAEAHFEHDRSWDARAPRSDAMAALLERHGKSRASREIIFREGLFAAGERIAVLGHCHLAFESHAYRDGAQRLVLEGREGEPLAISDGPWLAARKR